MPGKEKMNIPAIPTKYRGRQYRSLLEARWAAFFYLLRWDVEYEPFELNGWIPDFIIHEKTTILVEVKPVFEFPSDVAMKMDNAIMGTDWTNHELLIVGIKPFKSGGDDILYIGWLKEVWMVDGEDGGLGWDEAPLGTWSGSESLAKNPGMKMGFCHINGYYRDRITNCYDGGCFGDAGLYSTNDLIFRLWDEAANAVQWRRPA